MIPEISVKLIVEKYLVDKDYTNKTTLCALMMACGSDKGGPRHNYTTLYSALFNAWKNYDINLFELGIGTNNTNFPFHMGPDGVPGASLFAWAQYFPKGHIYGADIDKSVLFNKDRIHTYYCDQGDETSIREAYSNADLAEINFDIIIEDGMHEFRHNLIFLCNSMMKLKKGGVYIVEDLNAESTLNFSCILEKLRETFSLSYINIVDIPLPENTFDNTLLVIQK